MLQITIKGKELFNEETSTVLFPKDTTISLEHSLVSISKWEAHWHKPFISKNDKTQEELLDYVKCMTITQNVNPDIYYCLSTENFEAIKNYMNDPMTATTFSDKSSAKGHSSEGITSELIYYWMDAFGIPMECQKWHINRLLTLIRIHNIKQQSPKKMSKQDTASKYAALNAARRKKYGSKG